MFIATAGPVVVWLALGAKCSISVYVLFCLFVVVLPTRGLTVSLLMIFCIPLSPLSTLCVCLHPKQIYSKIISLRE